MKSMRSAYILVNMHTSIPIALIYPIEDSSLTPVFRSEKDCMTYLSRFYAETSYMYIVAALGLSRKQYRQLLSGRNTCYAWIPIDCLELGPE